MSAPGFPDLSALPESGVVYRSACYDMVVAVRHALRAMGVETALQIGPGLGQWHLVKCECQGCCGP